MSASLSNCPSGAGVVPTKSSSSSGSDLTADLMLRHKNLLYGGEEDRLTIIFLLRNFSIRRMPLRVLGTCIIAWNSPNRQPFQGGKKTFACAWREESDIHWSRKKAGILAFLPGMDCFDYFDPRHGTSRFPWSFKLFFSSSFSVWEEDWGDIVRQKNKFFFEALIDQSSPFH